MTSRQIQEMLTTLQWGMWLRYVKKNKIKNEGGLWPNYDFHEFYTSLDLKEVEGEDTCEGGSDSKGNQPLVPTNVPEGHGIGEQLELFPYDHITQRWVPHEELAALQGPGNGHQNIGPTGEQETGLPLGFEAPSGD